MRVLLARLCSRSSGGKVLRICQRSLFQNGSIGSRKCFHFLNTGAIRAGRQNFQCRHLAEVLELIFVWINAPQGSTMIREDHIPTGDADIVKILAVGSRSHRRQTKWKRQCVFQCPFDLHHRLIVEFVHSPREACQTHGVSMQRVGICLCPGPWVTHFFEDQDISFPEVLESTPPFGRVLSFLIATL